MGVTRGRILRGCETSWTDARKRDNLCPDPYQRPGAMLLEPNVDDLIAAFRGQDELGVVLRAHVHIEHQLERYIHTALEEPNELRRMEYSARVRLALACGLRKDLKLPLNAFGALRNKFAHTLNSILTHNDVDLILNTFSDNDRFDILSRYPVLMAQEPKRRLAAISVALWFQIRFEIIKAS
jgi:hypothetical protein